MADVGQKSRDTFTKSGAVAMKHVWEAQVNGKWMPLGEETCTKRANAEGAGTSLRVRRRAAGTPHLPSVKSAPEACVIRVPGP